MPRSLVEIPGAPDISGLTFRLFRGESDFPHMARIIDIAKRADGLERTDSVETISTGYKHLHNCDPYQDLLFAEIDGEPIGVFTGVVGAAGGRPAHLRVIRISRSRLEAPGNRPGNPELGHRAAAFDRRRATSPRDKVLRGAADGRRGGDPGPARSQRLPTPVTFGADMSRSLLDDLPDASLPEGLEIRPVEPAHLRSIWEADTEAFRDHWGARPPTERDWEAFLDRPFTDPSLWKVAWEGDRVVGQVRSFINTEENREYDRLRGYTENISTIKEWRKRGVARALICQSLRVLRDRGMQEAALGVHAENPTGAFHLYSSLGYVVQATASTYERPLD